MSFHKRVLLTFKKVNGSYGYFLRSPKDNKQFSNKLSKYNY